MAIDQAYQRRQRDTEGDFYRKLTGQSPRHDLNSTTQGFYIATAGGELLLYNNNRDPEKVLRLLKQKLRDFQSARRGAVKVAPIEAEKTDPRYNVAAPKGGLVIRVQAKILDGYEPTTDRWRSIFQNATSRDNLWVTRDEHEALVRGQIPQSLQRRIARYHLVDNTRGEPPMWKSSEIRSLRMELSGDDLTGHAELATDRGGRGYDAELKGKVHCESGRVVRFDMVCLGQFWGEGTYTRGAPQGKFPLAISFTLADGTDIADRVPPQGSRGWVEGYLR